MPGIFSTLFSPSFSHLHRIILSISLYLFRMTEMKEWIVFMSNILYLSFLKYRSGMNKNFVGYLPLFYTTSIYFLLLSSYFLIHISIPPKATLLQVSVKNFNDCISKSKQRKQRSVECSTKFTPSFNLCTQVSVSSGTKQKNWNCQVTNC